MGGMAAQIPIKSDPDANRLALEKVAQDKLREVRAGHDGTWVAHPGLVPVAREIFDAHMSTPNQIHRKREDVMVGPADLLTVPSGEITERGLRHNVDVGLQYLASWLGGAGCVPIYDLMEDAATAEISRSQVWQWVRHGAALDDGRPVNADLVRGVIREESANLAENGRRGASEPVERAVALFEAMMLHDSFAEWLTVEAYPYL